MSTEPFHVSEMTNTSTMLVIRDGFIHEENLYGENQYSVVHLGLGSLIYRIYCAGAITTHDWVAGKKWGKESKKKAERTLNKRKTKKGVRALFGWARRTGFMDTIMWKEMTKYPILSTIQSISTIRDANHYLRRFESNGSLVDGFLANWRRRLAEDIEVPVSWMNKAAGQFKDTYALCKFVTAFKRMGHAVNHMPLPRDLDKHARHLLTNTSWSPELARMIVQASKREWKELTQIAKGDYHGNSNGWLVTMATHVTDAIGYARRNGIPFSTSRSLLNTYKQAERLFRHMWEEDLLSQAKRYNLEPTARTMPLPETIVIPANAHQLATFEDVVNRGKDHQHCLASYAAEAVAGGVFLIATIEATALIRKIGDRLRLAQCYEARNKKGPKSRQLESALRKENKNVLT